MPEPLTHEETAQQIDRLGTVDFVVGIASQDHAHTIGPLVQAAWTGLKDSFPDARVAVLHAYAGARDGIADLARAAAPDAELVQIPVSTDGTPRMASPSAALAGGLHEILEMAGKLGVRGCAVLEADLTSVRPDWIARLLRPVAEDRADFVAPYYTRHRFAGALTTSVAYPFLRMLYGKRIRYPVASEFACSTSLLQTFLNADVWRTDLARQGIEVWLISQAMVGTPRLTQVELGVKTQASDGSVDLSGTLTRLLSALFLQAERTASLWQKVRGSQPIAIERANTPGAPEPVTMDRQRLLDAFRLGESNLTEIWTPVLPPLALLELRRLTRKTEAEFRFPDALWARIVFDFALAHRMRIMNRDHLLSAFTPLYSGWLASFIGELEHATQPQVEERVEQLCLQYEAEKPYLISRWRWPDRFSP